MTFVIQALHFVTGVITWQTWFHHIKLITNNYCDALVRHRIILYNQRKKPICDAHVMPPNIFVTKHFICWQNISSLNIFIFLIKLWDDNFISSPNVFVTKRFICWQNISSLNIFIFFFIFLINLWEDDFISSPNLIL